MRTLTRLAAILSLCATASAGEEVLNGSEWVCGGATVTVTITQQSTANTTQNTFTDGAGTSPAAQGTPGENSSASAPTTEECGATRTPGAEGEDYRIKDGKVQYKGDDGEWKNGKKKKKRGLGGRNLYEHLDAGEAAPRPGVLRAQGFQDLPLDQGELAPWAGVLGPGEEVTSLPQ